MLSTNDAPPVGSAPLSPFPSLWSRLVCGCGSLLPPSRRSINLAIHPEAMSGPEDHSILFGRVLPYSDQRKWPITLTQEVEKLDETLYTVVCQESEWVCIPNCESTPPEAANGSSRWQLRYCWSIRGVVLPDVVSMKSHVWT